VDWKGSLDEEGEIVMLAFGMVMMGLAAFAAMFAFVRLCDRV
jgi:hypothetical protein